MNARWWFLILALATATATATVGAPQHLPRQPACVVTGDRVIPIQVEVAMTPSERQTGLMERASLPPDAGMLFLYPEPQGSDRGFWMYRTLLPLDIAYLDATGRIVSLRRMRPCHSDQGRDCPLYPSGQSFSGVLEMNAGFFRQNDVELGDYLAHSLSGMTSPDAPPCRAVGDGG